MCETLCLQIDPIDGTTNFIHGFPFVAVSVAACLDKVPVLGLVLDPLREELFLARKGQGAYLNGERIHFGPAFRRYGDQRRRPV